jgi:transcriptional regulator with PAS, ATPase and Fis domain
MDLIALIGSSSAVETVRQEIHYAARSDAKVLITGESGVGKEIVARLIHGNSARRRAPLVTVNCAALTDSLLESELFGHVRGSFTGAYRDKPGVFELANRGTVFMDEIGETTPRMQGLLLRFLETGELQRVGSDRIDLKADVRVIAATNRQLLGAPEKTFRDDLYYRLNVIHIALPPLRERPEDVLPLMEHFLESFSTHYAVDRTRLSPAAAATLQAYHWPGNVRELKNVAERIVVRSRGNEITPDDLPPEVLRGPVEDNPGTQPIPSAARPSVSDVLFERMVKDKVSFWSAVYPLFMARDLTRDDLRAIVRRGLEQTSGSYRVLISLFQMPPDDYKRFLNFLRKHNCQLAFQPFRTVQWNGGQAEGLDRPERRGERAHPLSA